MCRWVFIPLLFLLSFSAALAASPSIGSCQIFPDDNPWNTDISDAPVHPNSQNYIANILANGGDNLHPDFGGATDDWYGIPWTTATDATPLVNLSFEYDDESDPGPYPIPAGAPIEGGAHLDPDVSGDRHILVVETTNCLLYEVYAAYPDGAGGYDAGSGAIWDLGSNDLRPEFWTSADAAGLPILPGLARCDEADSGTIDHALRFTVSRTQRAFIYPATHYASSYTDPNYPPMGLRLRLKAGYDTSGLEGQALAIAEALKTYGMILADNGSNWFISGEYNPDCWDDDQLNELKGIPGTAFEVIVSPPPPSEIEGDLIRNGGFEAGLPNGKKPSYWTLSVHKDRRKCSQSVDIPGIGLTDIAHAGRCAFEFKGTAAGTVDWIKQSVKLSGLGGLSSLNLAFYVARLNAAPGGGKLKIKGIYEDPNVQSFVSSIEFEMQTGAYALVSYDFNGVNLTGLSKVKLKFSYKGTSGKVWLDSISMVAETAPRALPLPPPAAG